jgi:hypothetical protein
MTPDDAKERARRFIDEIFHKRNLKYAEENLSEGFVEHSPYPPATGSDKRAALDSFQAILDSSDDVRAEILELIPDGRRVAIRARYSGTDTGGFIPARPRPTSVRDRGDRRRRGERRGEVLDALRDTRRRYRDAAARASAFRTASVVTTRGTTAQSIVAPASCMRSIARSPSPG